MENICHLQGVSWQVVTGCHTSPASTSLKTSSIRPRRFRLQPVTGQPVGLENHDEEYDLKPTRPSIWGHFQSFRVISNPKSQQIEFKHVEACWSNLCWSLVHFRDPILGVPFFIGLGLGSPGNSDRSLGKAPRCSPCWSTYSTPACGALIMWSQMIPWSRPLWLFVLWVSQSLQSRF